MSGYIKIPDGHWDYERRDCDCDRKEIIIINKDRHLNKKDCGCTQCKPMRPKQRGVILACGKQDMDIAVDLANPPTDLPIEIARVAVDITCLCSPLVLINFCSTIFVPLSNGVEYEITLFKECEKISKFPLAVYTFSRLAAVDVTNDSFCFKFCDFNNCTGCCFYTVELTNVVIGGSSTGASSISQGVISAKAQGVCDD